MTPQDEKHMLHHQIGALSNALSVKRRRLAELDGVGEKTDLGELLATHPMTATVSTATPAPTLDDIGMVWLGHASGWTIYARHDDGEGLAVVHRCGHQVNVRDGAYIGNIFAEIMLPHAQDGCMR